MAASMKLDLYKVHKFEYVTPKKPVLVNVKPAQYLSIEGKGEPGGEVFHKMVGALYGIAYTVKMTKKFAGKDYKVCQLEGLWWGSGKETDFLKNLPKTWNWKLLVRVPGFIKAKDVQDAVKKLKEKGKGAGADKVKLETIQEGQCVQMLHVGPYNQEQGTITQMMDFVREKGLACHGRHHEIYLSDPRRVPTSRLRTILRHPVR
jgi:hypothetical protein